MLWRSVLGKQWKSLDDAFYSKPPINLLRGSYWCWLIQGFKNEPKVWIVISFIGVKHNINGVQSNNSYSGKNQLNTIMGSWYVKNNKVTDLFLEKSITKINSDTMTTRTESGFELKLCGSHPNYKLSLRNGKKKIFECLSKSLPFTNKPSHVYEKSYNTKSFSTNDNKSYWLLSESVRFPQIVKYTNLFTNVDFEFFGRKFHGISYTEKNHNFGPAMPWKYTIFDFKDGSRFRFFWSYKSIIRTPSDLDMTFDYTLKNKKYFFDDEKQLDYFYLEKDMKNPHEIFCGNSKFLVIKATNRDNVRIELTAEILNRHVYNYNVWFLYQDYHQLILKLRNFKIFEKNKQIKINSKNAVGYGEYVNLILK